MRIPPPLQEFVNELVKSGQYACETEVIHHALWLLKDQVDLDRMKLESLRKDIAAGVAQIDVNEVMLFDAERIKQLGRQMLLTSRSFSITDSQ